MYVVVSLLFSHAVLAIKTQVVTQGFALIVLMEKTSLLEDWNHLINKAGQINPVGIWHDPKSIRSTCLKPVSQVICNVLGSTNCCWVVVNH